MKETTIKTSLSIDCIFKFSTNSLNISIPLKNKKNKTINICMNEKSIDISFIDNNFDIKLVNCVIIIELNTFLTIFNQGIGVFNFLKKIWKKQIKTEKFSYSDYRKFNSCFDFSNKKWDEYYKNC